MLHRVRKTLFLLSALLSVAAAWSAACSDSTGSGAGAPSATSTGAGGDGGMCSTTPMPLFTIQITANGGTVPADTTLDVSWSAATEPEFRLDDPSTWRTLETANVVCDVDRSKPPPTDLTMLVCHLWTSGPTEVKVEASGYDTYDKTLTPLMDERCGVIPSTVSIVLMKSFDAG